MLSTSLLLWDIVASTFVSLSGIVNKTARIFLGSIFVIAVLFRTFLPAVSSGMYFPPDAQAWLDVMAATGYLQALLYATEFLTGTALIMNIFVPLALTVLAPIMVNITLFHILLDGRWPRIAQVILMLGGYLLLVYNHRRAFIPLFCPVKPPESNITVRLFKFRWMFQIILGSAFVLPGVAKLLIPAQLSPGNLLIDGMKNTEYFYTLLGLTELLVGTIFLSGRFVPVALVISTPITINIFLYHFFLAPAGLPVGLIMLVMQIVLAAVYADAYDVLIKRKASIAK